MFHQLVNFKVLNIRLIDWQFYKAWKAIVPLMVAIACSWGDPTYRIIWNRHSNQKRNGKPWTDNASYLRGFASQKTSKFSVKITAPRPFDHAECSRNISAGAGKSASVRLRSRIYILHAFVHMQLSTCDDATFDLWRRWSGNWSWPLCRPIESLQMVAVFFRTSELGYQFRIQEDSTT